MRFTIDKSVSICFNGFRSRMGRLHQRGFFMKRKKKFVHKPLTKMAQTQKNIDNMFERGKLFDTLSEVVRYLTIRKFRKAQSFSFKNDRSELWRKGYTMFQIQSVRVPYFDNRAGITQHDITKYQLQRIR